MIKIFEDNQFVIFSDTEIDKEFVLRTANYLNKEFITILDFFRIDSFDKITIYIHTTKESFINSAVNRIKISSYAKGFSYNGEIHYYFDQENLNDYAKCGYDIASICHEIVHVIYNSLGFMNVVWLSEGIATYLSGQKSFVENDSSKYESFLNQIRNHELPPLEFLEKHGSSYGEFCDLDTNKYNGYDISYAFIRFLVDKHGREIFIEMVKSNEMEQIKEKLYDDFKCCLEKENK